MTTGRVPAVGDSGDPSSPFVISAGGRPCTSGADVCISKPTAPDSIRDEARPVRVGFVDVEGAGDQSATYGVKLALPLVVTSKVILFNVIGLVGISALLDHLNVLVEAANRLVTAPDCRTSSRASTFGPIIVVMRDVGLETTAEEQLGLLMTDEAGSGGRDARRRNAIRATLRERFESVRIVILPHPSSASFRDQLLALVGSVLGLASSTPHSVAPFGTMTGETVALALEQLTTRVNESDEEISMLDISNVIRTTKARAVLDKAVRAALAQADDLAGRVADAKGLPTPELSRSLEAIQEVFADDIRRARRDFEDTRLDDHVAASQRAVADSLARVASENTARIHERVEAVKSDARGRIIAATVDSGAISEDFDVDQYERELSQFLVVAGSDPRLDAAAVAAINVDLRLLIVSLVGSVTSRKSELRIARVERLAQEALRRPIFVPETRRPWSGWGFGR